MYIQQQQPPGIHYNVTGPSFPYHPYTNVAQRPLLWQPYTEAGSYPYQQAAQMMSMNAVTAARTNTGMPPAMMPDNSAMLATSQPHMHYMPNQLNLTQLHRHTMVQQLVPPTATKQSRTIKIINPETMREVDTNTLKKVSPASLARSTPKLNPKVQKQFKQTVKRKLEDVTVETTKAVERLDSLVDHQAVEDAKQDMHSVKKESGMEVRSTREDDIGEGKFVGESTGLPSLEDMSTTHGVCCLYEV